MEHAFTIELRSQAMCCLFSGICRQTTGCGINYPCQIFLYFSFLHSWLWNLCYYIDVSANVAYCCFVKVLCVYLLFLSRDVLGAGQTAES